MTCHDYQRRLSAYMDGELSRWTRWKIELHTRHCGECGEELRSLAAVDQMLLRSVERTPAPDYLTEAVMRRLPALPPARRSIRRMAPWAAALALAGAQLAALVGAYWVGFQRGNVQTGGLGNVPQVSRSRGSSVLPASAPEPGAMLINAAPQSLTAPRSLVTGGNSHFLGGPPVAPLGPAAIAKRKKPTETAPRRVNAPALPNLLPFSSVPLRLAH